MSGIPGTDRRDYEYLLQRINALRELIARVASGSGSGGGGGSSITSLTGDVTASGPGAAAATIAADAVSNSKLANMAQDTIKGRADGAGTGDPQDLTANQVSTILDTATDPFVRTSALPTATYLVPLVTGAEPPVLVSDGAGQLIFVWYTP